MTPTIRKILLPTDFGPSSERAAAYAAVLARGLGASVHLVHVLEKPGIGHRRNLEQSETSTASDQHYYAARARLSAMAAANLQLPTDRIVIEVRTGTPAEAIVDAAVAYGVDLIVMTAPARRRLPHLVVESVAERVLRTAPCPVLAVKHSGAAGVDAGKRAA